MEKKRQFGELELAILQHFRNNDSYTIRDILERLKGADKYTTIMTVMTRMAQKGLLKRVRIGAQYHYSKGEESGLPKTTLLKQFKEKIFGGKSAPLVSYLLRTSEDISDAELAEMETLITELKKSRGPA